MATPHQAPVVIPQVPQQVINIKKVLDAQAAKIAECCGKYLDPETLMRVAMATIYKTPMLQKCDPWSIANALIEAAQIGLIAGGPQQEGYLIPRKNKTSGTLECTFMPSYRGLMKVAIDSGAAAAIDAHVVYEHDHFEFAYGTTPFVDHRPALVNRGKPIAAYCAGTLTNGQPFLDVLSIEDIEKARKASESPDGPMWKNWWDEAARKTAIRRMCKRLKGTPALGKALELDATQFGDAVTQPSQRPMPKRLSETRQPIQPPILKREPEPQPEEQEGEKQTDQSKFDPPPGWDDAAADVTRLCGLLGKPDAVAEHLRLAMAADAPEAQVAALKASVNVLENEADAAADKQESFALAAEPGKGKGKGK